MSTSITELSEICRTATIVDLDAGVVWSYDELGIPDADSIRKASLTAKTHTYLIYWPGGLATYFVERLSLNDFLPSHIEAAHRAAKQLKPFTPFNWGRRK